MNASDIIKEVQENASEWLDEIDDIHDKHLFVVNLLAHKLAKVNGYVEYLERRLKYVSSTKDRVN